HMAEVLTDVVVGRLGRHRPCRTHDLPLDGTPEETWALFAPRMTAELQRTYPLDEQGARHLVARYGTRAKDVARYLEREPHLARRVLPGEPDLQVEFVYQSDEEMALFPADHWLRRTRLGLFHPEGWRDQEQTIPKLRRACKRVVCW